jgi:uncharacterized protein YceH (UPF0502 family)
MKLPRTLDAAEIRVLGALLEKEQATPEYYPLTLKALTAACNQRSNRSPVMELDENDVRGTLDRLHEHVLVWPVSGARSERWRHNLARRWELDDRAKAVMTLLLLRGPQTPGELRGRADRLYRFAATDEVESVLEELSREPEPLVTRLTRAPGQKESRWCHLAAGEPTEVVPESAPLPRSVPEPGLGDRLTELEERVAALEAELQRLREIFE